MRRFALATVAAFTAFSAHAAAPVREQVRAVGSSTVYPFVTAAAETFGQAGEFKTPIVESTGTGGGFKLFCGGVGAQFADIANASRPIKDSERDLCKAAGVTAITELAIGYDGIVLASAKQKPATPTALTKQQIFLALAREVPVQGKLAPNPYTKWKEIDPSLPDQAITVYGPPPTSGTRDAFVEMVMEKACEALPEFKAAYADEKARKGACGLLREDGKYVEAGEDDNLIIQKVEQAHHALGILGYSFLEANAARVQAASVDGVAPTMESIEQGKYGISRSLFVYVKNQHIGAVKGLREFVKELTSTAAIGPKGYLVERGLLPLHAEGLKKTQADAGKL